MKIHLPVSSGVSWSGSVCGTAVSVSGCSGDTPGTSASSNCDDSGCGDGALDPLELNNGR